MKHPRTKFKTILALLLALCLLTACGRQPGTEEPEVSTAAPAVPAETPTEPAAPEVPVTPPAEVPAIPTVGRLPADSLQVVYPTGRQKEEGFANTIADALRETYSCDASVVADSDPSLTDKDGLILVGDCKQLTKLYTPAELTAGDSYIAADDRSILVTGGSALSLYGAVTEFADRIRETGGGNLTLAPEEMFTPEYSTTRVMTFNILMTNKTQERIARVKKVIANYMPDSFGVQEANIDMVYSLLGYFTEMNVPYDYVGECTDGGISGISG